LTGLVAGAIRGGRTGRNRLAGRVLLLLNGLFVINLVPAVVILDFVEGSSDCVKKTKRHISDCY
jgi:hypothetical protein